jgi:hypothetical protein
VFSLGGCLEIDILTRLETDGGLDFQTRFPATRESDQTFEAVLIRQRAVSVAHRMGAV